MAEPARILELSPEDYLRLEDTAEEKSEYVDGWLRAMSGSTRRHNAVALNIVIALAGSARARGRRLYASDVKVRASSSKFYYPDVIVACAPEGDDPRVEERPCVVFEVLSESTEKTDRGEKLEAYLRLPTLEQYVLVHPETRRLEVYSRDTPGWRYLALDGEAELELPCLSARLGLDSVYAGL